MPRDATTGKTAATDRGEQTRRHIIEISARAFAECGYHATSLNELVRRSGLTKGAFYFHFASKEALALAVFEHKQQQMMGRLMIEVTRHDRALDQLIAMYRARYEVVEQDPASLSALRLCSEIGGDPSLAPRLRTGMTVPIDVIAGLVRRAQEEGDVRADVDARVIAEVAFAGVVGSDEVSAVLSGGADLRSRGEEFLALFLDAIRARPHSDNPA
jgi:AcrR family transcriptional regulator